jgi:hypothetical protein
MSISSWIKWRIAKKEMAELEQWRIQWHEHRRWFAEFPEAAAALDHMKANVNGEPVTNIHVVRDSCREYAPQAPAPLTDDFLQPNDYHLLHRFIETIEDDEGYDITKAEIQRLADLGVIKSHGFGKYSATMFGYWVHERYWEQNPSLPLKTNSDRDAEAKRGITGEAQG